MLIIVNSRDSDTVEVSINAGVPLRIHREDADPEHRLFTYRIAAAVFANSPQIPDSEPKEDR